MDLYDPDKKSRNCLHVRYTSQCSLTSSSCYKTHKKLHSTWRVSLIVWTLLYRIQRQDLIHKNQISNLYLLLIAVPVYNLLWNTQFNTQPITHVSPEFIVRQGINVVSFRRQGKKGLQTNKVCEINFLITNKCKHNSFFYVHLLIYQLDMKRPSVAE